MLTILTRSILLLSGMRCNGLGLLVARCWNRGLGVVRSSDRLQGTDKWWARSYAGPRDGFRRGCIRVLRFRLLVLKKPGLLSRALARWWVMCRLGVFRLPIARITPSVIRFIIISLPKVCVIRHRVGMWR